MKISELIKRLESFGDQGMEVMILDGFNGGGYPREINSGPRPVAVTSEHSDECADCEDKVGTTVIVIGYGCY